jgi:hypothetical protein
MGIGDRIEKAAENAMEDLAGTPSPTDDAHVPDPGAPLGPHSHGPAAVASFSGLVQAGSSFGVNVGEVAFGP